MAYRGQLIYQFDIDRDDQHIIGHYDQLLGLARFLFGALLLIAVIILITRLDQLQPTDLIIFAIFFGLLLLGYRRLVKRVTRFQDPALLLMEEYLAIHEYGLEMPPLANPALDPLDPDYGKTPHYYLAYNDIDQLELTEDQLEIKAGDLQFSIDLHFFPFYSIEADDYEDQLELFVTLFEMIQQQLDQVENRAHPTIIPRAFFRTVLPD